MLEIFLILRRRPLEHQLLFIRRAGIVCVTVGINIGVVGHADQNAIIQRQNHARQDEVVDEHRVPIVMPVAVRALPHGDAADRVFFVMGVQIEHVAAHLGNIHAAVPVPGETYRRNQVRL